MVWQILCKGCRNYQTHRTKKKGAQSLALLSNTLKKWLKLFDDVFALVGLAGGEGQLEVILSGVWGDGDGQGVGGGGIGPDLGIGAAGDFSVDVGDGGVGIDVHYSGLMIAIREIIAA